MEFVSPDNFEENREQDISIEEVYELLLFIFPDLRENEISFLYHGTYNVFEVRVNYIFRFPDKLFRNQYGIKLIQNEIKILNVIRGFIPVSIPDPEFISFDSEYPFMGYRKIEGISLSKSFELLSTKEKSQIGKGIGFFLSKMHSEDIMRELNKSEIFDLQFYHEIYKNNWIDYLQMVRELIFPILSSTEREWVLNLFSRFLDNNSNFNFQPVLVHGDFDISNILINPDTLKVTGIIDFEDCKIFDPAVDFLFFDEGLEFMNVILSNYKHEIDNSFKERQRFLFGRTCLSYIEFGLKNNINDMVRWGLKRLKIIKNLLNSF